jgi:hypothetical protein
MVVVGLCDKFELFLDGYGDVSVIPSGHDLKRLRRGEGGIFVCEHNSRELVKLSNPCGDYIRTKCFAVTYIPSASEYKLLHSIHICYEEDDLVLHTW